MRGDILLIDPDLGRLPLEPKLDIERLAERLHLPGRLQVRLLLDHFPGHRAIERAGIEIEIAEPLGQSLRRAALPRRRRPIDGNDQLLHEIRPDNNFMKPGKEVLMHSSSSIRFPPSARRPATVIAMATRWSACVSQ